MVDKIKENEILANHTTFRIGGPAKYFCEVKTEKDLVEALKWAKNNRLPYFVIGGGSNLLVSDEGFNGVIIKCQMSNVKCQKEMTEKLKVTAQAGVPLIKIIAETTRQGYSGAEWGYGIPGTIGGAICGNAGRLGQNISQLVESVLVLDQDFNEKEISKNECHFSYRNSIFKKNNWIILGATLNFLKKEQSQIEETLSQAKQVVKQHPPFPSAGCIFKNYEIQNANDPLLTKYPALRDSVRGKKIGVGYLIDQCGLKGCQIGGAKIWEGHANYIVNIKNASANDVISLIDECKKSVQEKFGIVLEEEIRYL